MEYKIVANCSDAVAVLCFCTCHNVKYNTDINPLPSSGNFCSLLITFTDQDPQTVGYDLDPNHIFKKVNFAKKNQQKNSSRQKNHEQNYLECKVLK